MKGGNCNVVGVCRGWNEDDLRIWSGGGKFCRVGEIGNASFVEVDMK